MAVTVDGKPPAPGYRYHWYFGDGTQQETSEADVTHAYDRKGPWLSRLVLTGQDGRKVLVEAARAITTD